MYWLRSGCMHLDREGPEIVKPCPAHAICAWVPNLFADVGKLCINVFVLPVLSVCCHCCVFIVVFSSSLIRTPPFVSRALHSLHALLWHALLFGTVLFLFESVALIDQQVSFPQEIHWHLCAHATLNICHVFPENQRRPHRCKCKEGRPVQWRPDWKTVCMLEKGVGGVQVYKSTSIVCHNVTCHRLKTETVPIPS